MSADTMAELAFHAMLGAYSDDDDYGDQARQQQQGKQELDAAFAARPVMLTPAPLNARQAALAQAAAKAWADRIAAAAHAAGPDAATVAAVTALHQQATTARQAGGLPRRRGRDHGGGAAAGPNPPTPPALSAPAVRVVEDPTHAGYVAPLGNRKPGASFSGLLVEYGFAPDPQVLVRVQSAQDLAAADPSVCRVLVFRRPYPDDHSVRKPTGAEVVAFCRRTPLLQQIEFSSSDVTDFSGGQLVDIARACPLIEAIRMIGMSLYARHVVELSRLLPRLAHIDPRDTPFAKTIEWGGRERFRFSIDQ